MRSVLLAHVCRCPAMTPTDAVKLLYQSEFGGGHLIRDEAACLDRLFEEYEATPQRGDVPLWEEIGGGMVRVNLAALDSAGLSPRELGRIFLRSAEKPRGSLAGFREKLALLRELTREGHLPFSPADLETWLDAYEAQGFPPVSHSPGYRAAYRPAYRVVEKALLP